MKALGSIEVCGYSTALLVINKMYHNSDIKVVNINFNKPAVADLDRIPLQVQVEISGGVEQVTQGLEIGKIEALKYNDEDEIIIHLIPNPYIREDELTI